MSLEKAVFYDPESKAPEYTFVQFNPETLEYSYGKRPAPDRGEKSAWTEQHQQQSDLASWEESSLSIRLFFNTYNSESSYTDVRKQLQNVRKFLCKTEHGDVVSNPPVAFAWGTFAFRGHMNSMSVTYQMFASDGTPVRAEARVCISGEEEDIPEKVRKMQRKAAGLPESGQVKTQQQYDWLFL